MSISNFIHFVLVNSYFKFRFLNKYAFAEVRTINNIIEDLIFALTDDSIKAIFCVHGGYGASDVMERMCFGNRKYIKIPIYHCKDNNGNAGSATGTLIVGNLSTFTSVLNTDFDATKINKPYIIS